MDCKKSIRILEDTPREILVSEIHRLREDIKNLNRKLEPKDRKILHQGERIKKLRFELYQFKQLAHGYKTYADRIYSKSSSRAAAIKREVKEKTMRQLTHRDYRVMSLSTLMGMIQTLESAVGLNTNAIGFLMWASSLEFFNKSDYRKDVVYNNGGNSWRSLSVLIKNGLAVEIKNKKYSLTHDGKLLSSKVNKFVEKLFNKI